MDAIVSGIFQYIEKIFFFFFGFLTQIPEYQNGVLLRWGHYKKVLKPGTYFIWPFLIDQVDTVETSTETIATKPQSLTTEDGKNIVISSKVKCNVSDPATYNNKVKDVPNAIEDITQGKIKEVVMKSTWEQCRQTDFDQRITERVRREAEKWGVYVERVTTADLQLTRTIRLMQ